MREKADFFAFLTGMDVKIASPRHRVCVFDDKIRVSSVMAQTFEILRHRNLDLIFYDNTCLQAPRRHFLEKNSTPGNFTAFLASSCEK